MADLAGDTEDRRVVFVQDFQVAERPYEEVVAWIGQDARRLFQRALEDARVEGERLRGRVCPANWPAVLAKTVELRCEPLRIRGDLALVAFSWRASGAPSLFPELDADLEIAPFGAWQTRLTLLGRYQPPGGVLGWHLDQLVLRRLAESTLRAFLRSLCAAVEEAVPNTERSRKQSLS